MVQNNGRGYGKPPREHQFQKGQSGNPKGRPPGTRSMAKIIDEEFDRMVSVNEGGRVTKMSVRRALVRAVVKKAASGDVRALEWLLQHAPAHDGPLERLFVAHL